MPTQYQDPGWGVPLRSLPFAAYPFLAKWWAVRKGFSPLHLLRFMFLSFVVPLFLILVILLYLGETEKSWSPWFVFGAQGLALVGGYVGVLWAWNRNLARVTEEGISASYFSTVFVSIAFSTSIPLTGFSLFFVTGTIWAYVIALGLSLPALWLTAPSVASIARRQQELDDAGSSNDLLGLLLRKPDHSPIG
jgi:hypothetical protein